MFDKQKAQETISGHAGTNPTGSPDRRRAQRSGREKGLRIFVPAAVLEAAGIELDGDAPTYTVQAVRDRPSRRSVIVRLYP